jgi:membrane protease YdiL (CAAX protease family)
MKHRNPFAVVVFSIITFGIYALVWQVKTKGEMNKLGAQIPTAWLIIIPFVNIWWLWKYSEGVGKVTNEKLSAVMSFVLLFLLSIIGMAIVQNEFNKLGTAPVATNEPAVPSTQPLPDPTPTPPPAPVA